MSRYERNRPYKSDTTRGSYVPDPRTYKGDVLVQVWIDSRILATLSEWLDKNGGITRYMSEVVKVPLEILVKHLTSGGDVELIDDTVVARRMLEKKYRVNLNPEGRGERNVLHNIQLSDRRKSLSGTLADEHRKMTDDVNVPAREISSMKVNESVVEEATRIYKELERKDREDAKQRDYDMIKNSGMFVKSIEKDDEEKPTLVYSESGCKNSEEVLAKHIEDRDKYEIDKMNKGFNEGPLPSQLVRSKNEQSGGDSHE